MYFYDYEFLFYFAPQKLHVYFINFNNAPKKEWQIFVSVISSNLRVVQDKILLMIKNYNGSTLVNYTFQYEIYVLLFVYAKVVSNFLELESFKVNCCFLLYTW